MPASSSLIAIPTIAAVLAAALAGCANAPEPSAAAMARKQHALAVARAAEYCRGKGLGMRANPSDAPTRPGPAAADFQFRCVKQR